MMSDAGWMIAVWFVALDSVSRPWHTQSLRLAENGAAWDQEGPGGLYTGGGGRGVPQQLREPSDDQAALTEVPQHRDKEDAKGGPYSTTQRDPTPPENHAGVCELQEGVLGLELHGAQRTLWKDANKLWQLQNT
ncbi:hypothetical protein NDU88_006356 [Pleurodeles waltl]|uniref:Uncharacterized protein n=1 Tax=Pleurodeles waltl TaxID=8319 RepID=A0AAV7WXC9_PLEWA|nr:hypothetical protein NDU88_006356 [Pleurodeles waltl]